jgi:hypothetical protein
MSIALRRKIGSPRPFGSFLAMGKEQYKIKSKLIFYPFCLLLEREITKNQDALFRFARYLQSIFFFWFW